MNAQNAIGVDKAPGRSVAALHGKLDAGRPSSPAINPATSPARRPSKPAPEASPPLSPQEQAEYDRCCAVIKQGPRTATVIGEALWRVDSQRLYRDQFASMKTFFIMQTDLEPEDGLKLIADWQAANSRSTTGPEPVLGRHGEVATIQEPLSTGPMPTKPTSPQTTPTLPKPATTSATDQPTVSTIPDRPLPMPRLPARAKTAKSQPQPAVDADESSTPQPLAETTAKPVPVPSSPLRRLKATQAMSTPPTLDARPATDANAPQEAAVDEAEALPVNPMRRLKGAKALSTKQKIAPAPTDGHEQSGAVVPKAKGDVTSTAVATGTSSDPRADGKQSIAQEDRTDKLQPAVDEDVAVIPLAAITLDESIQCRAALHKSTVNQYAERMKAGDCFPALIVYKVDDRHLLADGFHRFRAAEKAGLTSLPMVIRQGTRRDAIKFAIESNAKHGLPRTNADKRRSVALALQEFADFSEHVIADLCKVSQPFVGKVRRQLITVISSETRVGRDGKRRKMPKKKAQGEQDQSAGTTATEDGSGTGQQAGGTANDESGGTTTSHEGATGQEQATEDQSGGESDEHDTDGGEADYSLDGAWSRISEFLMKEFSQCPECMRTELVKRLGRFIDRQS